MAQTSGTVFSVDTRISDSVSPLQVAEILFTMSGTYDQAANSILTGIATLISNSRRNGKTITLIGAMCGAPATKSSDPRLYMGLKTVAIATNDITFEITESATALLPDFSTELAAATIPAQERPFSLLVSFYEVNPGQTIP